MCISCRDVRAATGFGWVKKDKKICHSYPSKMVYLKRFGSSFLTTLGYFYCFCRPEGFAQIRYAESSMRNGFGLKYLHKFLNLPFLQLQRETLLAQLETNSNETTATVAELDAFQAGPDADYNQCVLSPLICAEICALCFHGELRDVSKLQTMIHF